ncbi:uncharacterized protein LOC114970160 [Acropora millepora]|uniref:uncharacterized protein LOC114970160 n=1 Tax=Acropora millepora TaxID=45264 RepID=UPI001CF2EDCD|nr:uncharacterized protein LOC114970160 [Acropora millepora]
MFRGRKPKDASKGTVSSLSPKRVHVTFGESKRVLFFSEEDEVGQLRQKFLQAFSDSLADDIAVANVRFQQYDHTFKEYVDIENEVKLENNAKVKAVIVSFREKKEPSCGGDHVPSTARLEISLVDHLGDLPKYVRYHPITKDPFRLWNLEPGSGGVRGPDSLNALPDPFDGMITKDTPYRLWNLVSNGLIQPMNDNSSVVTCSGQFGNPNTVVKPQFYGKHLFYLTMVSPENREKVYLTAAQGENGAITLEPKGSDDALFRPKYYYGFTAFRSKKCDSLYLGCDNKLAATLVKMKDVDYPNPQALFTVNTV